ncbi:hypothetical protein FGIG_01677 [Fasciola gigantica]|uniref:Uncharacterized protein n=1 Tax=Fasciola gigantica TaxID=46835 RepID=A0A504YEE1_FASGI|nr:hypothetical protein FGIG_01677 [Fasciola gigantica]
MPDPDQNPHPHTQQSSPKFTVAFAAGDLISTNQHQSPSDSPEMNVTLGMVDSSVQARSVNTTPPSTKHSSSVVTDDSTTPSPSRFDGSSFALANRGPMNTSKRTLQTAFPVYSTPLYSHDLDRKRFAVGSVTSPSIGTPSICNTTHMTPSGMDTNHIRTTPSRIYSSSARLEHSGSPDTNPWSLPGIDTRSALAALSVAYSSLFRNQISSDSTVMPQSVSLPNPLRIPGPDTLSGMGKVGPVSDGSLTTGCTHTSPNNNAPLLISLSDAHGMDKFSHTRPGDKSAVITGKTSVAQSCSQSFPPAISNLLSDNLDCWQQFQQAAYANNLDPHFLALYSSAG